jgi:tetratricopeptide (TPR) repeat protein
MKSRLLFSLCLALSVSMASCSRDNGIRETLQSVDSLVNEHPDSAFVMMKSIDRGKIRSEADKAQYALLYSKAEYKSGGDLKSDTLINSAVDYYSRRKGDVRYAESLMYRGNALTYMEDYRGAIDCYKKAESAATGSNDYDLLGLINSKIAEVHYHVYSSDSITIDRYRKASYYFDKAADKANYKVCCLKLAVEFVLQRSIDSAIFYLNESLKEAIREKDTNAIIDNMSLMQHVDLLRKDYQSAVAVGRESIQSFGINNVPSSVFENNCIAYAQMKQMDSASHYLELFTKLPQSSLNDNYAKSFYYEGLGDYRKALEYNKKATAISDSLLQARRKANAALFEKIYDYQNVLLENQKLISQHKADVSLAAILGLAALLLIAITVQIIKQKKRIEQKQESLERQLRIKAAYAESAIKELSNNDSDKEKLTELLENKLKTIDKLIEVSYVYEDSPFSPLKKDFYQIMANERMGDGVLKDVRKIVSIKYGNILERLIGIHPELTTEDLDFVSLLLSGFSPDMLCVYYHYSNIDTVYVRKNRLAKKMGLAVPLSEYLNSLIG